jgi:hypothetical protein
MIIRRPAIFTTEISNEIPFVPAEISSRADFTNEVNRKIEFYFEESINFSYALEQGGDFVLTQTGDKIILQ